MKFIFEDCERVFAVRDISQNGIGLSLLEFGESLLFPLDYRCKAELKLDGEVISVRVRVARITAWGVGLVFDGLTDAQRERIAAYIDPIRVAHSLRKVDPSGAPDAFLRGISAWYHGDSGLDVYAWGGVGGGASRVLFCFGRKFWEWDESAGVSTGEIQPLKGDNIVLCKDNTPDPRTRASVGKVLEHAEVLDYRLVSFLKDKT